MGQITLVAICSILILLIGLPFWLRRSSDGWQRCDCGGPTILGKPITKQIPHDSVLALLESAVTRVMEGRFSLGNLFSPDSLT